MLHSAPLRVGAGLIAATFAAQVHFVGTGFAGSDSLPLVETSRWARAEDLLRPFTQPVMAGTSFANGELVYRPFASVTFGLDYAIWGLNAVGFHLTNLGLHLGTVLIVRWLLSLLGLCWWSSLAGAAVFALHPVVLTTVPVIARRDSVLPVLATCGGACLLLVSQRARGARRQGAGLAALLAMTVGLFSKESAFMGVAMVACLLAGASLAEYGLLRNFRLALPLATVALAVFAIRMLVLGRLGGPAYGLSPDTRWLDPEKWLQVLGAYTRYLIWAFAWTAPSPTEIWHRVGAETAFVLAITVVWLPRRHAVLAAAGAVWVIGFGIFCALLQISTIAFVAYFGLVGLALVFAASLEGALYRLRYSPTREFTLAARSRVASLVLLTGLTVAAVSWLWTSSLMRNYYQWQLAGEVNTRFLQALQTCLIEQPKATRVDLRALPEDLDDGPEDTRLLSVTFLEDYTVASGLRLAFPDRQLSVRALSAQTLRSRSPNLKFACTPAGEVVEFDSTA